MGIIKEWHDVIAAIRNIKHEYDHIKEADSEGGSSITAHEAQELLETFAAAGKEIGELVGASDVLISQLKTAILRMGDMTL